MPATRRTAIKPHREPDSGTVCTTGDVTLTVSQLRRPLPCAASPIRANRLRIRDPARIATGALRTGSLMVLMPYRRRCKAKRRSTASASTPS